MATKLEQMAQEALDARAKQMLVTKCRAEVVDGKTWYNVYQTTYYVEIVACTKYLRLRGLTEEHPEMHHLVRLKDH